MNKKYRLFQLVIIAISLIGGYAKAQCPSIDYALRSHDQRLMNRHWDTLVTCSNPTITLSATTFYTAAHFNGQYKVESIPYAPPDTTFHSISGGGHQVPISVDDQYDATWLTLPFPFQFFGKTYTEAVASDNGLISFGRNRANQHCAYQFGSTYSPIPNTASGTEYKNAIFGIGQDINTAVSNSKPNRGIYMSVYDSYPCRKLVVSYNYISHFSTSQPNVEYTRSQIVCYEGTNIVEVHVQYRKPNTSWDSGMGVIGIQDSTGLDSTYLPWDGNGWNTSFYVGNYGNGYFHHCYAAPGRNHFNDFISTPEAWRFTPLGQTICNIDWYYGTDTSAATGVKIRTCDSIFVYTDNDTGRDTAIQVSPTVPTAYTARMRYTSATGDAYDLSSTFTVGVSKDHDMIMTADTIVCKGEGTRINIASQGNDLAQPLSRGNDWNCSNSQLSSYMHLDQMNGTVVDVPAGFFNMMFETPALRDTDELIVTFFANTEFTNGCSDNDSIRIHFFNRIDDTIFADICQGQTYTFHGQQFNSIGTHSVDTVNWGNCPYTNTLRLMVHQPDDTVYKIKDCKPFTWIDGNTYEENTNTPQVVLTNKWGCDSTIHLNFVRDNGLEAIISATPEKATLDNLHLMFKDVSLASDSRKWIFPNGRTDTIVTVYYEYPTDEDSITVTLVAMRNYVEFGSTCYDTTSVTIPLLKEAIWFPNAFTPDRDVNNLFKIKGVGILSLEVEIYDRWGNFINSFEGIDNAWDGTTKDGKNCVPGAYVYLAKWTNVLDPLNPLTKKGTVLLLK